MGNRASSFSEAVHLWQWIKEDIGEPNPSKEFEAYSVQHLAQDLIAAFWGRKK